MVKKLQLTVEEQNDYEIVQVFCTAINATILTDIGYYTQFTAAASRFVISKR